MTAVRTPRRLRERLTATPIAHRDGPLTERVAAAVITDSGQRETQVVRVAAYVAKNPGSTARGIAAETTLDHYQVMRRLVDAERLGLVHKGDAVIREAHRLQVTWWPGPEVAAAVSGAVQGELL